MSDLLDYNPITGERVTIDFDHVNGTFTIGHHEDMQRHFDANQRTLIESDHQAQMKNDWIRYASGITNTVILKWRREHGVDFFNEDHWPRVMQLLNSREYSKLKTTPIYHDR